MSSPNTTFPTTPHHLTLAAQIAAIASVEVLRFVGSTFRGTDQFTATKIVGSYTEIADAYQTKATDLGVGDEPWVKQDLDALETQMQMHAASGNGHAEQATEQDVIAGAEVGKADGTDALVQ